MKRILLQATIVALAATSITPVVSARDHWLKDGLKWSLNQYHGGNKAGIIVAGTAMVGLGALAYEKIFKSKVKESQTAQDKLRADFEDKQDEIRALQAFKNFCTTRDVAFAALAADDKGEIQAKFDAYLKSKDGQSNVDTPELNALRVKIDERIKAKKEAFEKAYPQGKPKKLCRSNSWLSDLKFAGLVGASFIALDTLNKIRMSYNHHIEYSR